MEPQDRPLAATHRRYTSAQKEQAVRLVRQIRAETGEKHGAIQRVARQLGFGVETVRKWVNQADVDAGERPGTTTEDNAKIRRLEQENRELRRANEMASSGGGRNDLRVGF
jgi:transposase-like protein